jgi:signal transduction histidine kinase
MILSIIKQIIRIILWLVWAPFRFISFTFSKICNLLRFNISFKLTLFFAILIPTLLVIENLYLLNYAHSSYFDSTYTQLVKSSDYLHDLAKTIDLDQETIEKYAYHNTLDVYVYDKNGTLLNSFVQDNSLYDNPSDVYNLRRGFGLEEQLLFGFDLPSIVKLNVYYDDLDIILVMPFLNQKNSFQSLIFLSVFFNFFLILLAILLSNKMSRKLLKPIKNMTATVQNISISNIDERINIKGTKDELKDLALTFNDMMDRLETSYVKQRQFVNDASHELRTPIAVLKGYANMLNRWGKKDPQILEESIQSIISETNQMQSLVEKLLYLARNDKNSLKLEKNNFSMNVLIEEVFQDMELIDQNHKYFSKTNEHIDFYGDRVALKEAIRIFMDNSMKYTPENGSIYLSTKSSNKSIFISIADNGIGISKSDLPHVFERFYRADKSRAKSMGGTGLGLSIAKIIIEQHSGTIWIDSIENEGTIVTIILPR